MISLERARELIGDPALTDAEVEHVRDRCRILARFALEAAVTQLIAEIEAGKKSSFTTDWLRGTLIPHEGHYLHKGKQ